MRRWLTRSVINPVLAAALSDHLPWPRCWRLTLAAGFWHIPAHPSHSVTRAMPQTHGHGSRFHQHPRQLISKWLSNRPTHGSRIHLHSHADVFHIELAWSPFKGWLHEVLSGCEVRPSRCRDPQPTWLYEGADVRVRLGEPLLGIGPPGMLGAGVVGMMEWAACSAWHELIQVADHHAYETGCCTVMARSCHRCRCRPRGASSGSIIGGGPGRVPR